MLSKPNSAYHSDCGFVLTCLKDFAAAANYSTVGSFGDLLFRRRARAALGTIGALSDVIV